MQLSNYVGRTKLQHKEEPSARPEFVAPMCGDVIAGLVGSLSHARTGVVAEAGIAGGALGAVGGRVTTRRHRRSRAAHVRATTL